MYAQKQAFDHDRHTARALPDNATPASNHDKHTARALPDNATAAINHDKHTTRARPYLRGHCDQLPPAASKNTNGVESRKEHTN